MKFSIKKPKKIKKTLQFLPYFNQEVFEGILLVLPIHIVSEANCTEHWSEKSIRHNKQQDWVHTALFNHKLTMPCEVQLIRYAPRLLDVDDNLPASFKYVKDYIAAEITRDFRPGRADSDTRIKWTYSQTKSPLYGAKVLILFERPFEAAKSRSDLEF